MGLNDFLPRVLECAGVAVDLAKHQQGANPNDYDHDDHSVVAVLPPPSPSNNRNHSNKRRRPNALRIGIDVSSLIHKAAHGFGEMLGDERHLTNYGRAMLLQEQQQHQQNNGVASSISGEVANQYVQRCASNVLERLQKIQSCTRGQILVVLDGQTPPMKQQRVQQRQHVRQQNEQQRDAPAVMQSPRAAQQAAMQRTKAMRRAGAGQLFPEIVQELRRLLRMEKIPFLVAPYEADGQLAFLSQRKYIDVVITEDSDLVAHGATSILYKSILVKNVRRNNDEDEDADHEGDNNSGPSKENGKSVASGILLRTADLGSVPPKSLELQDMSTVQLACLFVAAGSDYCDKLKGIGVVKAARAVREAFSSQQQNKDPPLKRLFQKLYEETSQKNMTEEFKQQYEEDFMRALIMFRHPIVYDPISRKCIEWRGPQNQATFGDFELLSFAPYRKLLRNPEKRAAIVGDISEMNGPLCAAMAEGRQKWQGATSGSTQDNDSDAAAAPEESSPSKVNSQLAAVPMEEEEQNSASGSTQDNGSDAAAAPKESSPSKVNNSQAAAAPMEKEEQNSDDDDDDDDIMEDMNTQPMTQLLSTQLEHAVALEKPEEEEEDVAEEEEESPLSSQGEMLNTQVAPPGPTSPRESPVNEHVRRNRRQKSPRSSSSTPSPKKKAATTPSNSARSKKYFEKDDELDDDSTEDDEGPQTQVQPHSELDWESEEQHTPLTPRFKVNHVKR
jgi:5'-3' exonuclease